MTAWMPTQWTARATRPRGRVTQVRAWRSSPPSEPGDNKTRMAAVDPGRRCLRSHHRGAGGCTPGRPGTPPRNHHQTGTRRCLAQRPHHTQSPMLDYSGDRGRQTPLEGPCRRRPLDAHRPLPERPRGPGPHTTRPPTHSDPTTPSAAAPTTTSHKTTRPPTNRQPHTPHKHQHTQAAETPTDTPTADHHPHQGRTRQTAKAIAARPRAGVASPEHPRHQHHPGHADNPRAPRTGQPDAPGPTTNRRTPADDP